MTDYWLKTEDSRPRRRPEEVDSGEATRGNANFASREKGAVGGKCAIMCKYVQHTLGPHSGTVPF